MRFSTYSTYLYLKKKLKGLSISQKDVSGPASMAPYFFFFFYIFKFSILSVYVLQLIDVQSKYHRTLSQIKLSICPVVTMLISAVEHFC